MAVYRIVLWVLWCLFVFWRDSTQWTRASSFTRFLDHSQRRTTVGMTPLDEWSARRRDLYLTTHNTTDRHPCPPPWVGFEPTVSPRDRPQTYTLDLVATRTGSLTTWSGIWQCTYTSTNIYGFRNRIHVTLLMKCWDQSYLKNTTTSDTLLCGGQI
jgi:hypothetical protein